MESPLTIAGDVDIRHGNVCASSDVIIEGDVRSGMTVESPGSVIVRGTAENCAITAAGDIRIQEGVLGRGEAHIRAGANIEVGHVRSAMLEAEGSVRIGSSAMQATILSGKTVVFEGQGVLIGGLVVARDGVYAKQAGHKGVEVWDNKKGRHKRVVEKTRVQLGLHPKTRMAYNESLASLRDAEEMASLAAKNALYLIDAGVEGISEQAMQEMQFVLKLPASSALVSSLGAEAAAKTNARLRSLIAEMALALPSPSNDSQIKDSKLRELCLQLYHLFVGNGYVAEHFAKTQGILDSPQNNLEAAFEVTEFIFSGVEITLGFTELLVENKMAGTQFTLQDGKIVAQPLDDVAEES